MRAHLTEALKRRKSDEGFSLIELIVVVAILAILVAIAVPIFMNVQQQARDNALATITANGATQAAAAYAQYPDATTAHAASAKYPGDTDFFDNLIADTDPVVALTVTGAVTGNELDTFCVEGTQTGAAAADSGPGC